MAVSAFFLLSSLSNLSRHNSDTLYLVHRPSETLTRE